MIKRLSILLLTIHCLLLPAFAGGWLKLETETTINLGPFVKIADGSLEEAATVANVDVVIIKQSNTSSGTHVHIVPAASATTHDMVLVDNGMWNLELTTTDTNTLGRFEVTATYTGCYPVFDSFMVVAPDAWERDIDGDNGSIEDARIEMDNNSVKLAFLDMNTSSVPPLTWEELQSAHLVTGTYGLALDATITSRLAPTVAARTLDVTATGAAGVDWANVENPTTTVGLSGTTISTGQVVASVSGAVGSVTGSVGSVTGAVGSVTGSVGSVTGLTASDVGAIKTKTDFLPSATAGTAGGVFIAGSNAATSITSALTANITGNLSGSVGSVTGAVGSVTGSVGSVSGLTASNLDTTVSSRLAPTVAGRTLDVSSGGEAGVDWANVGSPTTTVNLSGTTISTGQVVASVSGAVGSVTGAVGSVSGLTASDVGAIKTKTDFLPSATAGAAGGVFIAGTNAATTITTGLTTTFTGNLTGSVASVTGAVGSVTGAVGSVTGAVGSVTGLTNTTVKNAVWDEPIAGHLTAGTTGLALNSASSAGDPWSTLLPGLYAGGTAGNIIGNNLNATVSSRMATYTQPTGFLAATFPGGTIANTTNITAGTIATVTTLTNLPSIPANWITATGINADAFTAAKFASDVGNEFAESLFVKTDGVDTNFTLRQILRVIASFAVGKSSGYNTNAPVFRDLNDTKNVITSTTNATGRTAVTLNP